MKITFTDLVLPKTGTLVLTVAMNPKTQQALLGEHGMALDKAMKGTLVRSMNAANFTGKAESTARILTPAHSNLDQIIIVGLGDVAALTPLLAQNSGGAIAAAAHNAKQTQITIMVDHFKDQAIDAADLAVNLVQGVQLRNYSFDKYRTAKAADKPKLLAACTVATQAPAAAQKALLCATAVANGVKLARDLVCEPGNILHPVALAAHCVALRKLGVKVEVLDEKAMAKLGMGALLGVAQGSVNPPRLVSMLWEGKKSGKAKPPVALVGKGVTFDSGGISLKPGAGMEEMIFDMAGAAAVIGTMHALAASKAAVNVVGVVGLVENMPDGKAQRPGDIVTSMSGQTIEVHNTDAEGRLVLADAVWYTQQKFKPSALIDLATLTGAIIIALGHEQAGLFTNNDQLAQQLQAAGTTTGEKLWRLPLGETYNAMINADTADMKNISGGREAGSIIGAQFIQRFIKADLPWAHLDIAGTAWLKKAQPLSPKGATGYGVRLLYQYLTTS